MWPMPALTRKMLPAMIVASQKESLNRNASRPNAPTARLAKPTSCWKGLPGGQPMEAAISSAMKV